MIRALSAGWIVTVLAPSPFLRYHGRMDPDAERRKTMTRTVEAVYQNGVLRPLEPLNLPENERVTVTVTNADRPLDDDLIDTEFLAYCDTQADDTVSLEAVREALAKIPGSLTDDIRAERDER
jgi:predicted DNA-binding antitoxin AbrB/MazE fold protein